MNFIYINTIILQTLICVTIGENLGFISRFFGTTDYTDFTDLIYVQSKENLKNGISRKMQAANKLK